MFRHLAAVALIAFPSVVLAEAVENKGLEIAREADSRGEGFGDLEASMRMVLISKRGETSERELRVKTLEGKGDEGDKGLTIFDTPADVRGTALLTWSYKSKDDDQWLYLPALRRVKTIASKNQSGSFMGSEFAFEDMRSQEVEKYTYKFLKEEPCGELTCFVSERYPTDKYSGYTRQITWLDTKEYRVQKVEYYDRKESLLKTLTMTDYQLYKDKFWRPGKMHMVNHQTGKATELYWTNYKFDAGLKESDFTQNSLMRAR
ncbi:MAG: outer membrane lipoprotein-sorting protein [Alcanivoracaceae bacterium]|nr:outer membrane lipoprotein-sorting protein [Alcanivoracaceae bacterium]